jgi:hypothetical protein
MISLIDCVEEIKYEPLQPEAMAGLEGLPVELEIVTMWMRSDAETPEFSRSRLSVELPNGDREILSQPTPVNLREYRRLRSRVHVGAIPLRGSGRYHFLVELERAQEWAEVARLPLDIEGPEPAAEPPIRSEIIP